MKPSQIGTWLIAGGGLLVAIGVVGLVTAGGNPSDGTSTDVSVGGASVAATPSTAQPTPSAAPTTTTTEAPPTSESPTTTVAPSTTTTVAPETVEAFLDLYTQAFSNGDTTFLVDRLNQATLDRYGQDQCAVYLTETAGTIGDLTLREIGETADWDYATDERSQIIQGATGIEVQRVTGGETLIQEIHWQLVDGAFTWFSDCGDPIN